MPSSFNFLGQFWFESSRGSGDDDADEGNDALVHLFEHSILVADDHAMSGDKKSIKHLIYHLHGIKMLDDKKTDTKDANNELFHRFLRVHRASIWFLNCKR